MSCPLCPQSADRGYPLDGFFLSGYITKSLTASTFKIDAMSVDCIAKPCQWQLTHDKDNSSMALNLIKL